MDEMEQGLLDSQSAAQVPDRRTVVAMTALIAVATAVPALSAEAPSLPDAFARWLARNGHRLAVPIQIEASGGARSEEHKGDELQVLARWRPWLANAEVTLALGCKSGWRGLIIETIDAMIAAAQPDGRFAVRQIKEKLGGLRLYTSDPRLSVIAHAARDRSHTICEVCGSPGRLWQDGSRFHTACDRHGSGQMVESPYDQWASR